MGIPLSVSQAEGVCERQTLNRQRPVFWRNGQSVIPLNGFEKQGEETDEISKLIIGKNSLSVSLRIRKNELFYITNIYLLFSQTHTH